MFRDFYINKGKVHYKPQKKTTSLEVNLLLELSEQLSRGLLAVTLGVVLSPEPEILASLLEGTLSLPSELSVSAGGVGSEIEDIASTTGGNLVRLVLSDGGGEGADHLVDGAALSGTQVPGADTGVVGAEVFQGLEVAVCEIQNVDVIADGGSVVGSVV